jgi:hypothetical protein
MPWDIEAYNVSEIQHSVEYEFNQSLCLVSLLSVSLENFLYSEIRYNKPGDHHYHSYYAQTLALTPSE